MSLSLSPIFNGYQSFLAGGLPNSGGWINTYLAGTSTPALTFTTPTGNIANPAAIQLDSSGRPPSAIWLTDGTAYKFIITDAAGLNPQTFDFITGSGAGSLAAPGGAGLIGWLQTGIGAVIRTLANKLRGILTVSDFGAVGDGVTDDTAAFRLAIAECMRRGGMSTLDLDGSCTYRLTGPCPISYAGAGIVTDLGIHIRGNNAKIFLAGTGYTAFDVTFDVGDEQGRLTRFSNLTWLTDNVNRPSAIRGNYAAFMSVDNCVFYRVWDAVTFNYGLMNVISGCAFFGCNTGAHVYRSRDSRIVATTANQCAIGFFGEGINDVGRDGGYIWTNVAANTCSVAGFRLKGLYTPVLTNVVCETCPILIDIIGCLSGVGGDWWLGPASPGGYSIRTSLNGAYSNDYWSISNVVAQSEMEFSNLNFPTLSTFNISQVNSSISGASMHLNGSTFPTLDNMVFHGCSPANDLLIESNSSQAIVTGGRFEKGIYLNGLSANRGASSIHPAWGIVRTGDGYFRADEDITYFDGTRKAEVKFGQLLPSVVASGNVAASTTINFDVRTILSNPATQVDATFAEFFCIGGLPGSTTTARITAVRSQDGIKIDALDNVGGLGSLVVAVSGFNITMQNVSGSTACPYRLFLKRIEVL